MKKGMPLRIEEPRQVDMSLYTEWALKKRGFELREEGQWLTGFYHWNRPGIQIGGHDPRNPDEYGINEVAFCPVGEESNAWAETTWKHHFPGIYAWYTSDDMRAYQYNALLLIKSDTYVHTSPTFTNKEV